MSELKENIKDLHEVLFHLHNLAVDYYDRYCSAEDECERLRKEAAAAREAAESALSIKRDYDAELENFKTKLNLLQSLEEQLADSANKAERKLEKAKDRENKLNRREEELTKRENDMTKREAELTDREADYKDKLGGYNDLYEKSLGYKSEISTKNEKIKELEGKINGLEKDNSEKEKTIAEQQKRITSLSLDCSRPQTVSVEDAGTGRGNNEE